MTRRGVRIGALKHDAHQFQIDAAGTDTDRLHAAGAVCVAIYSPTRSFILRDEEDVSAALMLQRMSDVDLILLEGGKELDLPKIEVVRAACASEPVCATEDLLAICTDVPSINGAPCFALDDIERLADYLISSLRNF